MRRGNLEGNSNYAPVLDPKRVENEGWLTGRVSNWSSVSRRRVGGRRSQGFAEAKKDGERQLIPMLSEQSKSRRCLLVLMNEASQCFWVERERVFWVVVVGRGCLRCCCVCC